ncbi:NADH-quinone oxidoreductase subunit NuoE [Mycobacterium sp. MYCO198283]|uniref:NADH-quinone oxidoreductase subunit NuoE n=1 Tax=Mycobacterium sp. MYCO198283 TaxID=2883505 RepID=UPI001E5ADDA5|nr:NADH-quinone oxidoreductase subunit NuoE [Mycobacterium sp. MYCO198283]MCG5431517.1 NADH-quinone oxidoreductase subunit NuoE [Mycobacterium sp. MYCO198283]
MSVPLTLGPRPDEPTPPITAGPRRYPEDVTARLREEAGAIIARYPRARSALLPLLHLVQGEDGYLTPAGIAFCATELDLSPAEVTAVATFYSMYRRTPTGEYLVGVCTTTLCAVMGGDAVLEALENHLGIAVGGTTDDGMVTLEHVECNAACDYAPVVMVNWEFFDNQNPATARQLVDDLRAGNPVAPTRGSALCTFRQTARVLAGIVAPADTAWQPGGPTVAGLDVARAQGMSAPRTDQPPQPRDEPVASAADAVRDQRAPAPSEQVPPNGNGQR